MIAFGHTAVGALVGVAAYEAFGQDVNPFLGLVYAGGLGIVSHYVADFIPHGHFFRLKEYKAKIAWVILFDLFVSLGLFLLLSYLNFDLSLKLFYVLFAIGGSQLPDILDGLLYIGVLPNKGLFKIENTFHTNLHWHGKGSKALLIGWLDLWQVAIVIIALAWLFKS